MNNFIGIFLLATAIFMGFFFYKYGPKIVAALNSAQTLSIFEFKSR